MANQKHLTLQERKYIESKLCESDLTISALAKSLCKNQCTIQREILKHRSIYNKANYGRSINNCANRNDCPIGKVGSPYYCNEKCSNFEYAHCIRRDNKHFCCNGCTNKHKCVLTKYFYVATVAQTDYEDTLSTSRQGINITEEELNTMGALINDLVRDKGQSINAAILNNPNEFNVCSKTVYNYVNMNLFETRNIHLARKVRFSPRKNKVHHKIDRNCTKGRSYQDFLDYIKDNPLVEIVEGDSVESVKGSKVLLTLYFRSCGLQLSFLRDANNATSVIDVINNLYKKLGHENFTNLFPVLLLDNGSEFSNPDALENYYEYDEDNNIVKKTPRTKVFYCDPSAPYQKGCCERNHEFIRYFIPKGKDFKNYTQEDIDKVMNNINSYGRAEKKNFKSPTEKFLFQYSQEIATSLGIELLQPNDVVLNDSIFKK